MSKLKPILPSLREKKRYLAFNIISKDKITSFNQIKNTITESYKTLFGEYGLAEAGLLFLKGKYNKTTKTGLIRVNHKHTDKLKFALTMIKKINNSKVIVRCLGISGVIKKAEIKYLKETTRC